MKKTPVIALLVLLALVVTVYAKGRGSNSGSGSKPVHVKGYYKKDGTYVQPHTRALPGHASTNSGSTSTGSSSTSSAGGNSNSGSSSGSSTSSTARRSRPYASVIDLPREPVYYRRGYMANGYKPHYTVRVSQDGKIKRSSGARAAFVRQNPCPSTGRTRGACPGYVVDHVAALACGGADHPSNMQWQSAAAAKAKDANELWCR
jgi:hypothetical protein